MVKLDQHKKRMTGHAGHAFFAVLPQDKSSAAVPTAVLRTKIHPFDRYILGLGEIGMIKLQDGVKTYFVTIPAHKFLHIENRESNGYWDFWEKQSRSSPGRTARRSAACWTASRASWTTPAAVIPTVCPSSSWRISTTLSAACATGVFCAQSATADYRG